MLGLCAINKVRLLPALEVASLDDRLPWALDRLGSARGRAESNRLDEVDVDAENGQALRRSGESQLARERQADRQSL